MHAPYSQPYTNALLPLISQDLVELDGYITTIQINITTLQGQVSTLQGDVTTMQGQITTLQGQVATLQSDVTTLQSVVSTLSTQVATNTSDITTLQGQVMTLITNVTTLQGQVGTLQTQMTTAQADITALQAVAHTHSNKPILDAIASAGSGNIITNTERTNYNSAFAQAHMHGNMAALNLVSGSNTGDQTITLTGDAIGSGTGTFAVTVSRINGQSLAALGTGILKNTTVTGVPSIAIPSDFPTLNQNTTGTASAWAAARTIGMTGDVAWTSAAMDGTADVTGTSTIGAGVVSLSKMANVATATVFYRKTAGTGSPEVQNLATLKTDLGFPVSLSGTDVTGTLPASKGGTGQPSYNTGDILYASGSSSLSKLNIGSTGQYLSVVGGVPAWVTDSDVFGTQQTYGETEGNQTVNSGTMTTYQTITTGVLPAGDYRVEWYFEYQFTALTTTLSWQLVNGTDTTTYGAGTMTVIATGDFWQNSGQKKITLTSGAKTINLQMSRVGLGNVTVRRTRIYIFRVS